MNEPKCYRCSKYVYLASIGWSGPRCALGYAHEFPHIGCEEFDGEPGTDWAEREAAE